MSSQAVLEAVKGGFKVEGSFFKGLVGWIAKFVSEATFKLEADGLRFCFMDVSHVAMLEGFMPSQFFSEYRVESEGSFCFDAERLLKILRGVRKGCDVALAVESGRLTVSFQGEKYSMPLLKPGETNLPEPKIWYTVKAVINRRELQNTVKRAGELSDNVVLKATDKGLTVRSFNSGDCFEKHFSRRDDPNLLVYELEQSCKAVYGEKMLLDLLNFPCETVQVEFAYEKPVKLTYQVGVAVFHGWLAPRIEDSEPKKKVWMLEDSEPVLSEDEVAYGPFKKFEVADVPVSVAEKLIESNKATEAMPPEPSLPEGSIQARIENGEWAYQYPLYMEEEKIEALIPLLKKLPAEVEADGWKPHTVSKQGNHVTVYVKPKTKKSSRKTYLVKDRYTIPLVEIVEAEYAYLDGWNYSSWKPLYTREEAVLQAFGEFWSMIENRETDVKEETEKPETKPEKETELSEEERKSEKTASEPAVKKWIVNLKPFTVEASSWNEAHQKALQQLETCKPEIASIVEETGKVEKPTVTVKQPAGEGSYRARKAWIKIWLKKGRRDKAEALAKELGLNLEEIEKQP